MEETKAGTPGLGGLGAAAGSTAEAARAVAGTAGEQAAAGRGVAGRGSGTGVVVQDRGSRLAIAGRGWAGRDLDGEDLGRAVRGWVRGRFRGRGCR